MLSIMASLQEARREADEAAARIAAEDEATTECKNRGGIVENMKEGAESLLGSATRATEEPAREASDKARETKDAGMDKAGEMKDRAKEGVEETVERASETKDRSIAKMMEYEGMPREEKGSSGEKHEEYKASAAAAARKAREFLITAKEEACIGLAGEAMVIFVQIFSVHACGCFRN